MPKKSVIYTKQTLIKKLKGIALRGWVPNARHGNVGGVGNTLEDLLHIKENNLPIPNAAEWELKSRRLNSSSLATLFHMEPSPRAIRFVPQILSPKLPMVMPMIWLQISFSLPIKKSSLHRR